MREYFELVDDVEVEGRWFLNGLSDKLGRELDSRDFTYGLRLDVGPPLRVSLSDADITVDVAAPLDVSLRRKGCSLDFTFADFDMPVVTRDVAELLADIAGNEFQRIPVTVKSSKAKYEIINVTSRIDCIDTK